MRLLGVALLGLIVGCGGGTPPVTPPLDPPPGTLYALDPSLKPIPNSALTTRAPTADEFWVGKGKSVTLKISAKQLSPLAKKVRLEISVSTVGLGVTPLITTLEGSANLDLLVTLDSSAPDNAVPYFFINGYPLDANGRTLANPIRVDFRWDVARPPTNP
jgi:hypothetical protein